MKPKRNPYAFAACAGFVVALLAFGLVALVLLSPSADASRGKEVQEYQYSNGVHCFVYDSDHDGGSGISCVVVN